MAADDEPRNKLGNECACGEAHYCRAEVMEMIHVLRGLTFVGTGDAQAVNELLKKYDPEYYRRRVRQSQDASKART